MKELKFRAWNAITGQMVYFGFADIKSADGCAWVDYGDGMSVNVSACEVMQFTGLCDKNGKEIYQVVS